VSNIPDYNLGRAHGEIEITADTRGAQEAQAAMAATAAEAEALDKSMNRVNETFDKNREKSALSAEQLVRERGRVEELRVTYERYNRDYQEAANKREDIERRLNRAKADEESSGDRLLRLGRDLQRARDDESRMMQRMETAYERFQTRLQLVRYEVERFNQAHMEASRWTQRFTSEVGNASRALTELDSKLSAVGRTILTITKFGLGGGGAGASLGLLGGAGIQGLTTGVGGILEVLKDFSAAMLLVPGVVNGAVLSLGTLAVGFHGVAQELQSLEDPQKFLQGLRELAPAAQQAMLQIQGFTYAMRGARLMVQESLFEPIIRDIQPLIQTWLPQLMNAGQRIANEFGQAFHQVFQFFQQPAVIQGFQQFVGNMVRGFQAARTAIEPFLSAWNTLAAVGSGVFERMGTAIATVAQEFNAWVQNAASTGKLTEMINSALTAFTELGHIIRDLGIGFINFFNIAEQQGGNFIQIIAQLAAEFRHWTESAEGSKAIAQFFKDVHQASQDAMPIVHDLGQGFMTIVDTLLQLGHAAAPGITSFFGSLVQALQQLGPQLVQAGPAIGQFFQAFGQTLLQVVQQLGPSLPNLFQSLSQALIDLLPVLPPIANALAKLFEHLTPKEVEMLILFIGAIKGLKIASSAAEDILALANPITLVILGIGLLVAGIVLLIQNWGAVERAVGSVTDKFGGLSGIIDGLKRAWDGLTDTVSNWWNKLTSAIGSGWDSLVNSFNGLADKITTWWDQINWEQMGKNLVQKIINGITGMAGALVEAGKQYIVNPLRNLFPSSRAKDGPFAVISPEELGAKMGTDYASGIESAAPRVYDASSTVATGAARGLSGSAAGSGSGGGDGGGAAGGGIFTSAGATGISGKGLVGGGSGFDQWIDFVTKDMQAWSKIGQDALSLFTKVTKTITDSIEVVASVWNQGRNPLTQAGGIAGPPLPSGQQTVPGVPNQPIYGPPPRPELAHPLPGQGPPSDQQQVPGVPNVPPGGNIPPGPAAPPPAAPPPAAPPPAAPPPQGAPPPAAPPPAAPPPAAPPPAGPPTGPGQSPAATVQAYTGQDADLAGELKKSGFTDSQIVGLVALNRVETGNWSHPESIMGLTNNQTGPGIGAHVGGFKEMWDRRQRTGFPSSTGGTATPPGAPVGGADAGGNITDPGAFARYLLDLEGYSPTTDWAGNKYPAGQFMSTDAYAQAVTKAYQGVQTGSAAGGPAFPEGGLDRFAARIWNGRIDAGLDPRTGKKLNPGESLPGKIPVDDKGNPTGGPGASTTVPQPGQGGLPTGPAKALGPYQLPESSVTGITPVTEPSMVALGQAFGGPGGPLLPSTYPGHQVEGGEEVGIDWGAFTGWTNRPATPYQTQARGYHGEEIGTEAGGSRQLTREEADREQAFAMWVGQQPGVEQVIYMNPYTGFKVGYHNGQPVGPDMPGTVDPGYYRDDWTGHTQHTHTRMTQRIEAPPPAAPQAGPGAPAGPGGAPQIPATPATSPPGGTLGGAALGAGLIGAGIATTYGGYRLARAGVRAPFRAASGTYRGIRSLIDKLRGGYATDDQVKAYQAELAANGGDEDAALNKVFNITPDEAQTAAQEAPEVYEQIRTNVKSALGAGTPRTAGNLVENLLQRSLISPEEAAGITPDLMVNVYHATSQSAAEAILREGFRQAPGRNAFFTTDPQSALTNLKFYGGGADQGAVIGGRIPVSAWKGPGVPIENLKGVQWQQLSPEEIQRTIQAQQAWRGAAPTAEELVAAGVPPEIAARVGAGSPPAASVTGDAGAAARTAPAISAADVAAAAGRSINIPAPAIVGRGLGALGEGAGILGIATAPFAAEAAAKGTPLEGIAGPATAGTIGVAGTAGLSAAGVPVAVTAGTALAGAAGLMALATMTQTFGMNWKAQSQNARRDSSGVSDFGPPNTVADAAKGLVYDNEGKIAFAEEYKPPAGQAIAPAPQAPAPAGPARQYPSDFVGPIPAGAQRAPAPQYTYRTETRTRQVPEDRPGAQQPPPGHSQYYWWYGDSPEAQQWRQQNQQLRTEQYQVQVPVKVTNPADLPGGRNAPPPQAPTGPAQPPPAGQPANPPVRTQGSDGQGGQPHPPAGGPGEAVQTQPQGPGGIGPQSTDSPLKQFETGAAGIASIIGDAFKLFDDVITNIKATGDILDTVATKLKDTESIVKIITDFQTFLTTAADIAKTVGDVANTVNSFIPSAGGADFGGTEAAKSALAMVAAVAGIVESAIEAVNASISLGIEVYHEIGKYAGYIFGAILGGSLGTLGGNVRMLYNTRTGQVYAYSEDNPLNKNTINLPFGTGIGQQPASIGTQVNQMNMYTGPGQSPMQMMQNTMWMVSTGAPQVASVAAGSE
jgi:hypothetical protein